MAAGGTKLGDAYISVTADATRVARDLERELAKSTAKITVSMDRAMSDVVDDADKAGRQISSTLAEEIADGIKRGLSDWPKGDTVKKPATEQGSKAGNSFADSFRKRVDAALRSLPEVTIGAATGEAEQKIRDLAVRLRELSGQRVGVDVSAEDALAELAAIKAALTEVGGNGATVDVRADVAAAVAQLAAIEAQVSALDGRDATVDVNVDDHGSAAGASSRIGSLIAVGIGLGSVLVPAAAAAALAIAGIGAAAAGAGAGLGVIALGFSGVSDAVKLLGQKHEETAKKAATAAGGQVSSAGAVAAAQRGVESATASLANTQANAADAAVRSARKITDAQADAARVQVATARAVADAEERASADVQTALDRQENAERDLTAAQKDQLRAQEDLTQARKDAQDQLEDLANRVTDNVLDQRQALLDVADAQADLQKVLADPKADAAARARAQLTYDQQVQAQKETRLAGERLAEQQAEAAAQGVEGSDAVVAAQQRVADTTTATADAAKAAADAAAAVDAARIKAADDVAQAQADAAQKVADAQQKVTDAIADQAIQQRQSAFSVSQAMAGVVSAQAAVAAASATAGAAGSAAYSQIDADLAKVNPATLAFAGFIDEKVLPAWERLKGVAAGGLLPGVQRGLESVLEQEPRITGFIDAFARSAGGLLEGSIKRLSDPSWSTFFSTLQTQGVPQMEALWHAGDNVAEALANIWVAFAPLGTDMAQGIENLTTKFVTWSEGLGDSSGFHEFTDYVTRNWPAVKELIGNVAEIIGHVVQAGAFIGELLLPPLNLLTGVLAGLPVPVVVALLTAFLGYKAITGVSSIISGVGDSIGQIRDQVSGAGDKLSAFKDKLSEAAEGGAGKLKGGLDGVIGAMGGPLGIATVGAGILLGAVTSQMSKAAEQTERWTQAIITGGTSATQMHDEYLAQFGGEEPTWFGHIAEKLGFAASLDDAREAAGKLWREMDPLQQATQKQAEWTATLRERLLDGNATDEEVRAAKERLAYWTGEVSTKQGLLDSATQGATGALAAQKATLDELTGKTVTADEATANYYASVDQAKASVEGMTGQVDQATGKFDLHTQSGRDAQGALLGMRDAGNDLIQKMIEQGATSDEVKAKDGELRQTFIDTAMQMGLSQTAAETYATQILGIPGERATTITADTAAASTAITGVATQVLTLPDGTTIIQADTSPAETTLAEWLGKNRTLSLNTNIGSSQVGGNVKGRKAGGRISGPGSGTSDSILGIDPRTGLATAWVSNMEYVVNARRTAENLPLVEAINAGRVPAGIDPDMLTGLAGGGRVYGTKVIPVDLDTDALAGVATAASSAGNAPAGSWQALWQAVKAAIPAARINDTYRPGANDRHGMNKAIDFGYGSGPGGAGSAGLASIASFLYRNFGRSLYELIYDGLGDITPDVKRGADFTFSELLRKQHTNHVHAAVFDEGGWLQPGTTGINLSGAPEPVFSADQWSVLQGNLQPLLTADTSVAGQVVGYLLTSSTALTRIAGGVEGLTATLGSLQELVGAAITEATEATTVAADTRWGILVTLRELAALLAEIALMTETIGKAQATAAGLNPGTVSLARSDADKIVVLRRSGQTAATLASQNTAAAALNAGLTATTGPDTAERQQFAFEAARAEANRLQAEGDLAGAALAHDRAAAVYVTYSPSLQVPTVPTAGQAAAILEQDLARSLRLGLLNAQIGEVTVQ